MVELWLLHWLNFGCKFGYNFLASLWNNIIDELPNSIKYLDLSCFFNRPIEKLPSNLENLRFGYHFNSPVKKFPKFLKLLEFGHSFNQPIIELPDSLTHLTFGSLYNQDLNNKLPNYLIKLTISNNYYCPFNNLPITLKIIEVTRIAFDNKIVMKKLPWNCEIIYNN